MEEPPQVLVSFGRGRHAAFGVDRGGQTGSGEGGPRTRTRVGSQTRGIVHCEEVLEEEQAVEVAVAADPNAVMAKTNTTLDYYTLSTDDEATPLTLVAIVAISGWALPKIRVRLKSWPNL